MQKRLSFRIISILSTLVLLLNCFMVQAATPANQFSDVKESAWYYTAVKYAVENNLMNGVGGGKFDPNGAASRAMLVTLLYRMEGKPSVSLKTPFTDLKDDWYKAPIAWAYANKIVNGTSNTTFGPTNPLTREQFATIMYRYCKESLGLDVRTNAQLSGYPDHKSISDYAKDAMIWANAEGLITGSKEGNKTYLRPQQTATRAQMATIFQRFDTYLEQKKEQQAPVAPPAEKPCDFGGEPYHKSGTRGMQSRHYYFCRDDGCLELKEVACSIRVETIPATCQEYSFSTYSCALCGYEETIVDSSSLGDHSWNEKPTHINYGQTSSHRYTCQYKGCLKVKEEPCTFTITKTPATSDKDGTINYSCALCGYSYSVVDPDAPALNPPTIEDQSGAKIKLMTQNLRQNGEKEQGTDNDAQVRQYRFKALVEKYDPDVIATQEFDDFWKSKLPGLLGDGYALKYKFRESPSGSDEACAILWKKDKFDLLDNGYFWLSENPNSSNPAGFGQYHPRIVNWVKLQDKATGEKIVVYSAHFGSGSNYTTDNMEYLRGLFTERFKNHPDAYCFVMGDFNFNSESDHFKIIADKIHMTDLRHVAKRMNKDGLCTLGDVRTGTNNRFEFPDGNNLIDFILAQPNNHLAVNFHGILYDQIAVPEKDIPTGYVSDHFAVYAEVRVGTKISYKDYWSQPAT